MPVRAPVTEPDRRVLRGEVEMGKHRMQSLRPATLGQRTQPHIGESGVGSDAGPICVGRRVLDGFAMSKSGSRCSVLPRRQPGRKAVFHHRTRRSTTNCGANKAGSAPVNDSSWPPRLYPPEPNGRSSYGQSNAYQRSIFRRACSAGQCRSLRRKRAAGDRPAHFRRRVRPLSRAARGAQARAATSSISTLSIRRSKKRPPAPRSAPASPPITANASTAASPPMASGSTCMP